MRTQTQQQQQQQQPPTLRDDLSSILLSASRTHGNHDNSQSFQRQQHDQQQQRRETSSGSNVLNLSKSLGDYSGRTALLQRHISDISNITYSGYLLKRSNFPVQTVTPVPLSGTEYGEEVEVDYDDTIDNQEGTCLNRSHFTFPETSSSQQLHPNFYKAQESNFQLCHKLDPFGELYLAAEHDSPVSSNAPALPQHLQLLDHGKNSNRPKEPASLSLFLDNHQHQTGTAVASIEDHRFHHQAPTGKDDDSLSISSAMERSLQFAASFFGITLNLSSSAGGKAINNSLSSNQIGKPNSSCQTANTQPIRNRQVMVPSVASSASSSSTSLQNRSNVMAPSPARQPKRSAPIKMVHSQESSNGSAATSDRKEQHHHHHPTTNGRAREGSFSYTRRSSEPLNSTDSNGEDDDFDCKDVKKPADFVDRSDGHLWRAKYCVLESGVLYFYRHQSDAESHEARCERQQCNGNLMYQGGGLSNNNNNNNNTTSSSGYRDLSKSPMPSKWKIAEGFEDCLWEKRVALDCVGAVRSAEAEYGKHSFELIATAPSGDDDDLENDKLVLRARNAEEMGEWLFQFHRSIATYVKSMMEQVADSTSLLHGGGGGGGDPRHNLFHLRSMSPSAGLSAASPVVTSSPIRASSNIVTSFTSPRYKHITLSPYVTASGGMASSLSHGHGRSMLHRRRMDLVAHSGSSTSSGSGSRPLVLPPSMPQAQVAEVMPFPFPIVGDTPHMTSLRPVTPLVTHIRRPPRLPPMPIPLNHHHSQQQQQQPPTTCSPTAMQQQQQQQQEVDDSASPEISAPQCIDPETERPPPSQPPSGGKYVPPHMRNRQGVGASAAGSAAAATTTPPVPPATATRYVPPHLRDKSAKSSSKYVPPHMRANNSGDGSNATEALGTPAAAPNRYIPRHQRVEDGAEPSPLLSLADRATMESATTPPSGSADDWSGDDLEMPFGEQENSEMPLLEPWIKLGGCADPDVVHGSILDDVYIPRKSSRLEKVETRPFGCNSDRNPGQTSNLSWEIGAVSECGIRDANEDSYLIANDLSKAFRIDESEQPPPSTLWSECALGHPPGLLAVFDGHCGDHAARFAAERLIQFIYNESIGHEDIENDPEATAGFGPRRVENILRKAIIKMDREFCELCVDNGRSWESGATALIAAIVDEHLVIANLGDARGIMSRSVSLSDDVARLEAEGWTELPSDDYSGKHRCLWKQVTDIHSPAREEERKRIETVNGWITTETEIPIGQFQRMDLFDGDVIDILKRCFADRYQPSPKAAAPQRILQISRVCGELAVSRSIGDRDFKAAFNAPCSHHEHPSQNGQSSNEWDCPLLLPYPDNHSRCFSGDLVSNNPDFQAYRLGELGYSDEFLLLACDGLWDVMDADDAIRVTRDLLFEKKWPAKRAAARLAQLAIHLGSSDNITVIVVRFQSGANNNQQQQEQQQQGNDDAAKGA